MQHPDFARKLIAWYHRHQRALPWRATADPYRIWLSEIILQQTRVAQGQPYYFRFLEAFPDVQALAAAPLAAVLRVWQGLGYYSRARNLHACAQAVVKTHGGKFPRGFDGLRALPGIGPYTAAAVASFAFKEPVAVVDGNVFRVLARVFGFDQDTASPAGRDFFFAQANALLDPASPDLFNQALMEFGALQCIPRNPDCSACIFEEGCFARRHNLQQALPVKAKKTKVRPRYLHYFVLVWKGQVLMRTRTARDIWRGLHDFVLVESQRAMRWERLQQELHDLPAAVRQAKPRTVHRYRHVLSHQVLHIQLFQIELKRAWKRIPAGYAWQNAKKAERLAKPIVLARYLREIGFAHPAP